MFNGALDRYDWKLVGKRELYVPYNTNKFQDTHYRYSDLIGHDCINPDAVRWELHRVWQVEATLKPDFMHVYSRRTIYLDEDSWMILISDRYDGRGPALAHRHDDGRAIPRRAGVFPGWLCADGSVPASLYGAGMHNRKRRPITRSCSRRVILRLRRCGGMGGW